MAETSTALALVSQVRSDEFAEQVALALPDNMPAKRFVRATVTALLQNPEIAKADPDSVFNSLLRAAQDGLLPDGREAALVMYGSKATYLPMIGGYRKIAAEYGWAIRANVVYPNDVFDHTTGLDETLVHHPARPGADRGEPIAAYAVGSHRDGRKQFVVMYADEIAKVRASSRASSKGPWVDWQERMWQKTAARRLFKELPLDPADARVSRLLTDGVIVDAVEQLYGPDLRAVPESPADALETGSGEGGSPAAEGPVDGTREEAATHPDQEVAASTDIEEGEWEEAAEPPDLEAVQVAGSQPIPGGVYKGETLATVAATDAGAQWLLTQLRRLKADDRMRPAIETYVEGALPETWQAYQQWRTEQAA